ncbi:MAG: hypothetical protein JXA93_10590 [Anaerolineae bacterium]|nr:hypothetical protein [Anaerolineae bacterium]
MVERHPWPEQPSRADEEKVIPWAEGNGLWAEIARLTSDLSAIDVITFLVQNPHAIDTAQSIAERIGRRLETVAPILESLVDAGLVERINLEGMVIYQLAPDPHHQQTLQQYVTWIQEAYHWARLAIQD